MKIHVFLILFCLCIVKLSAQSKTNIDSLHSVLAAKNKSTVADTSLISAYCELGKAYTSLKNDSAVYYLQKALNISIKYNHKLGLLKTYIQFGKYYTRQFLPAKAIEYWFKALVIAEQLKDSYEIGNLINRIGDAYKGMNDYDKALKYFRKYASFCKNSGSLESYLLSLNNIGGVYFDKKDYANALHYFNLCDSLNRTLKSPKIQTAALINTGLAQIELKDYDGALKRFKIAINIEDNYDDRIAFVGNEIAKVYLAKNNVKEALKYAILAENNVAKTSVRMNSEVAKTLSEVHDRLGHSKLAFKYYRFYTKARLAEDSTRNSQLFRLVQVDYENEKSNERITKLNLDLNERQANAKIMRIGIVSLLVLIIVIAIYYQALSNKNSLIEAQKTDIQQLNESLENKVRERTKELTIANKELKRKNDEIREALLRGQTMERERVASELHDNIGGTLAALKWRFEALDRDNLSEREKKIYDGILKNMHKAYGEIRLISHNMLPAEFEEQGLIGALEKFLADLNISSNGSNTRFRLDTSHLRKTIRQEVALELYICCFESINNIIKHAHATDALIAISDIENGALEVRIEDNGNGFIDNAKNTGKGIKNIISRLERIHAKMSIISTVNEGSKIHITVPESLWEIHSALVYIG